MKKVKRNNIDTFDIGKMTRIVANQQRFTKASLGRKLGRNGTTITRLLKTKSMQAYLIWEFSMVLKHNFFQDLADILMSQPGASEAITNGKPLEKARITELEKENAALREERDYLKKMIDILSKK